MTDGSTTWLSASAHQKLVDELHELMTQGRQRIAERIGEARSHGDIRENADYDAAKNEQGLLEARIRKIQTILDTAEVSAAVAGDVVGVGTVVTVRHENGDEMDVFLASQENKVPGLVLASPSSPLGSALLGARIGASVSYHAPGGTFNVEVVAVRSFEG